MVVRIKLIVSALIVLLCCNPAWAEYPITTLSSPTVNATDLVYTPAGNLAWREEGVIKYWDGTTVSQIPNHQSGALPGTWAKLVAANDNGQFVTRTYEGTVKVRKNWIVQDKLHLHTAQGTEELHYFEHVNGSFYQIDSIHLDQQGRVSWRDKTAVSSRKGTQNSVVIYLKDETGKHVLATTGRGVVDINLPTWNHNNQAVWSSVHSSKKLGDTTHVKLWSNNQVVDVDSMDGRQIPTVNLSDDGVLYYSKNSAINASTGQWTTDIARYDIGSGARSSKPMNADNLWVVHIANNGTAAAFSDSQNPVPVGANYPSPPKSFYYFDGYSTRLMGEVPDWVYYGALIRSNDVSKYFVSFYTYEGDFMAMLDQGVVATIPRYDSQNYGYLSRGSGSIDHSGNVAWTSQSDTGYAVDYFDGQQTHRLASSPYRMSSTVLSNNGFLSWFQYEQVMNSSGQMEQRSMIKVYFQP